MTPPPLAGKSLLALSCLLSLAGLATAQVTYVDASAVGAGNGSSWSDAYVDLQTALAATGSGEIWSPPGPTGPEPPASARRRSR